MTFKGETLFLATWLTFVCFPFVHMVPGDGILAKWGVLDFARGFAVHKINTDLAGTFAAIAWLAMDWMTSKRPELLGLLTGAVACLATITPAAGHVSPPTACLIGVIAGVAGTQPTVLLNAPCSF